MPIAQKQYPVRFSPRGLVDAYDATDTFPGACINLANLVFDQSNPEIMVSRPGVSEIYDFADFSTPGVVSVQITVGNVTYGMVASARNSGKDEPFAYDHDAGAIIVVSGVTNALSPTTQATTGEWTPPTMAVIGTKIIVTHPGFPGGATKFGWFDISVAGAAAWSAGDTATNALPSVPVAVANFFNRAYFACTNTTPFSDVLDAVTRTNSTQILTIGDTSDVLALSGLPVQTTSSGIVQALLLFKEFQIWQVTGDVVGSTLALNYLSLTTGCASPRSVVQSPRGTYFAGISGPMIVEPTGGVRAVVHSEDYNEADIQAPYQNATTPSRICAGYSGRIYRTCMTTTIRGTEAANDYWFDGARRRWNGPHTFAYDCASQLGNYFVLCSNASPAKLFKSEVKPSLSSVYTDDGALYASTIQSSTMPKMGEMEMKQIVESTMELASAASVTGFQITALDEIGNTLSNTLIAVRPTGTLWQLGVWGGFNWASSLNIPFTYTVPWDAPLVFKKLALYITGTANTAIVFGTFFARWQDAGYTTPPDAYAPT